MLTSRPLGAALALLCELPRWATHPGGWDQPVKPLVVPPQPSRAATSARLSQLRHTMRGASRRRMRPWLPRI